VSASPIQSGQALITIATRSDGHCVPRAAMSTADSSCPSDEMDLNIQLIHAPNMFSKLLTDLGYPTRSLSSIIPRMTSGKVLEGFTHRGPWLRLMIHLRFGRRLGLKREAVAFRLRWLKCSTFLTLIAGRTSSWILRPRRRVPSVLTYPYDLERLLLNLALNCADAPCGGALTIRTVFHMWTVILQCPWVEGMHSCGTYRNRIPDPPIPELRPCVS